MRPWIVWATGLLAYIVAVLDRTTLGVSGLEAGDRFAAGPSLLSSFVVLQIVVYAGAQVPAGLLLDRFGSKALIVAGATVMAAGQLTLAFTESLPVAIAARAVVGLGDAVTFISVLRLVPHWFSAESGSAGDPADRHLRPTRPGALGGAVPGSARGRRAGPPPTCRWSHWACCRSC